MRIPWQRANRHPVGQVTTIQGERLGIVDFGADLSRDLRVQITDNILTHGEPFQSGGVLGNACLPVVGVGSTVVSSLFAGNVFLATANPATLMQIGAGLGSQVMGPKGIVAHAPFIAAGGAILPVTIPLMFFSIMSSMMMSVRFEQIQETLDNLARCVEQLLVREVASDFATLLSAMARLRDISEEFAESRRFTDEMRLRIALVERDVNTLHHKYDILSTRKIDSSLAANLAVIDVELYTVSSIADIEVDSLRLKLALQDNPDDVTRSLSMLNSKIDRYEESFRELLKSDSVKSYQDELRASVDSMGWWKRNVSARRKRKKIEADVANVQKTRDDSLDRVRLNLARWSDDLSSRRDTGRDYSVLYYRENDGRGELKAFYTSDWQLQEKQ